nr:hypothetical protein [Tanacetum cinerariifolium]
MLFPSTVSEFHEGLQKQDTLNADMSRPNVFCQISNEMAETDTTKNRPAFRNKKEATAEKIALLVKTGRLHSATITLSNKAEDPNLSFQQVVSELALGEAATTGSASDATGKKKGRIVTLTTDDMQKRKNDVKARTTLLLSLPDEHQL